MGPQHPVVVAHADADSLPPPLTVARFLTTLEVEWVPLLAVVVAGGLYLYGVRRLRRRGDAWSWWRAVSFVGLGLGSMLLATQTALAAYDTTLLWVHMVQHMVLNMLVPIFLALGAPVTLALRTLPPRGRTSLLRVVHSRPAAVLTNPFVAGVVFVANPFVLYFTGLYEATLRNPLLHDLNHLHFVLVGSLWFWVVLGLDPLPNRPSHPFRLLAVFATLPFHAFLGISIMGLERVVAADWYAGLGREWGPSLLRDQEIAGGILWATGDLVAVLVLAALFVQWVAASEREAAREDRRLDRLDRLEESGLDPALRPVPPRAS